MNQARLWKQAEFNLRFSRLHRQGNGSALQQWMRENAILLWPR